MPKNWSEWFMKFFDESYKITFLIINMICFLVKIAFLSNGKYHLLNYMDEIE